MQAGDESVSGSTLHRCVGKRGFGEVWKATGPGGIGRIESHRVSFACRRPFISLLAAGDMVHHVAPVKSDGLLDLIVFHIQSTAPVRIGAISLASDWSSLASPSIDQP